MLSRISTKDRSVEKTIFLKKFFIEILDTVDAIVPSLEQSENNLVFFRNEITKHRKKSHWVNSFVKYYQLQLIDPISWNKKKEIVSKKKITGNSYSFCENLL
jgi:hypothetical protein